MTVPIEAACSHYRLLKEEALAMRIAAARIALERTLDDPAAQQVLQHNLLCQNILAERKAARRKNGKKCDALSISEHEPEAMVQRLKRGRGFAASYKPSVLANENRIITAQALHVSSETHVMAALLDQSERVIGNPVEELLLDAGYFEDKVIEETLARDISLLCPAGRRPQMDKAKGLFHKSAFNYDLYTDSYRCPAGQTLIRLASSQATPLTRAHAVYGGARCDGCALRTRCTTVLGRKIKRYPEDDAREALCVVMQHPQAKQIFSQRQAIVEPVFSQLRCQQNFNRFRRRGLLAVKREFASARAGVQSVSCRCLVRVSICSILHAVVCCFRRKRKIWIDISSICRPCRTDRQWR